MKRLHGLSRARRPTTGARRSPWATSTACISATSRCWRWRTPRPPSSARRSGSSPSSRIRAASSPRTRRPFRLMTRRRPGAAAGEARGRGALRAAVRRGAGRPEPGAPSPREVLADGLGVRHVVVGADFRFGKGRAGDAATLQRARRGGRLRRDRGAAGLGRAAATSPRPPSARRSPTAAPRRRRASSATGTGSRAGSSTATSAAAALGFPTANLALDGLHLPRLRRLCRAGRRARRAAPRAATAASPRSACGRPSAENAAEPRGVSARLRRRPLRRGVCRWRWSPSSGPELRFDGVAPLVAQMRRRRAPRRGRAWRAAGEAEAVIETERLILRRWLPRDRARLRGDQRRPGR